MKNWFRLRRSGYRIGPVGKTSRDNGLYLQSAIRFGVTDGSDDMMLKLFVGREF